MPQAHNAEFRNCQICGKKMPKMDTGTAAYQDQPFYSILSCEPCFKKSAKKLGIAREWERFEADETGYENVKPL